MSNKLEEWYGKMLNTKGRQMVSDKLKTEQQQRKYKKMVNTLIKL